MYISYICSGFQHDEYIRDVWDRSALRYHSQDSRFFSKKENLAVSLNTDGVALFKLSTWRLWPVFLNLLESIRMKAENVLLCGSWYGPNQPSMSDLFEPVLKNTQQLAIIFGDTGW